MYPIQHAVISLVVGVGVVAWLRPGAPAALVLAGVAVGTLVDLDHFLLSRLDRGDWRALRGLGRRPLGVFLGRERLFADGHVHPLERLLSHVLVAGPLAAVAWVLWPPLGTVVGAVLYAHVLADLAWDVRRQRRLAGEA